MRMKHDIGVRHKRDWKKHLEETINIFSNAKIEMLDCSCRNCLNGLAQIEPEMIRLIKMLDTVCLNGSKRK